MKYFFSRSAAKSRYFFRGELKQYFEIFGLEYSYWLSQLNLSRLALIFKFKRENINRIRKSHNVLQLLLFENLGVQSSNVVVVLCGTPFFYTSEEIRSLIEKTGKLFILFNPDKKHESKVVETWKIEGEIKVSIVLSEVSIFERTYKVLKTLFFYNKLDELYAYRNLEFEVIKARLESALNKAEIELIYTKDIIAPFDMFFLYNLQSKEKIWKNIAPASLEQEYLRFLNMPKFPLTQAHFYSDYQKQTVLKLNYIKNPSFIKKIIISPEPYFSDIFKVLDSASLVKRKVSKNLLIIGVWAHGGKNSLRKNFEFAKFLLQIGADRSLKKKFNLIYKPHPNKFHSQLFLSYLNLQGVIIRDKSEKIIDLINEAEVVISWGSLSTVYAIGLKKQVIYPKSRFINFWIDYEKDDFESNDLVEVSDSMKDVVRLALSGQSHDKLIVREKKIYEIFGLNMK